MTNNLSAVKNKGRAFDSICRKLGWTRGSLAAIKHKCKWYSDSTPAVDANSHGTYPVQLGEMAYDHTGDAAYICSVKPTASTAATFVKMHA